MTDEKKAEPTICSGQCKHEEKYHVVLMAGTPDRGCCRMDCQCARFVPAKAVSK